MGSFYSRWKRKLVVVCACFSLWANVNFCKEKREEMNMRDRKRNGLGVREIL
jgi:hypothetical protein